MLPWLLPDEDAPQGRFVCGTCEVDDGTRAAWHCGWISRSRWAVPAQLPADLGGAPYKADVCPGWLTRQQAVCDGAHAYAAMKAGCLAQYYPEGEQVVLDAAMECQRAFNAAESERIRRAEKRR